MTSNRILHVIIRGRVQGVGYRAWTHHQAQLHGLNGWVRNRRDGSVEAVFSGPGDLVDVMLKACRQGPRGAVVEAIEEVTSAPEHALRADGFEVRETA